MSSVIFEKINSKIWIIAAAIMKTVVPEKYSVEIDQPKNAKRLYSINDKLC